MLSQEKMQLFQDFSELISLPEPEDPDPIEKQENAAQQHLYIKFGSQREEPELASVGAKLQGKAQKLHRKHK